MGIFDLLGKGMGFKAGEKIAEKVCDKIFISKDKILIKGTCISCKKLKESYYNVHKNSTFLQRYTELPATEIIVVFGEEGYWLNEIVMLNIEKDYETIRRLIFNEGKQKSSFTKVGKEDVIFMRIAEPLFKLKNLLKFPG